ncbi:hypothetical protein U9R71_21145 [Bacillus toyonensis]|uniref:DUF7662 domain-containing protein n=1 Tax=Bacillus toyonensis TaxID=155322 RepID=UPI0018D1D07F|nr:hypothetical protein [Bacillus toyonensis]MBH0358163.1 hypothetical protein [Bacillus toyonensis biovar Thuringiensis]
MLIKFFRPEHVQMFLDGNLYFRNTGYFIDLEETLGEKGIGDKYEGSFFRVLNPEKHLMYIELKNGKKIKMNFDRGYTTERYEAAREFQLTCFTRIPEEDMECVDEGVEKIKDEVITNLAKEFPDRIPVLITNEIEFFDRVSTALREKGVHALHSHVKYFDEHIGSPLKEEDYEKDITQAFFYKRNFFKEQKEYRIITSHPVEGDSLTVNLGDLSNCVASLEKFDTLKDLKLGALKKEEVAQLSKYAPLGHHLSKYEGNYIKLSFEEIEKIISDKLPKSASTHKAWWSDDETHVQANAWLEAQWKVDNVVLGEYVEFVK